jgi:antitoxin PrlF
MPRLTSRGRVTIPVKVRSALGIRPGDWIEFVEKENGQFAITLMTHSSKEQKAVLRRKVRKPS